jgi:hypothetical protein
MVPHEAKMPYSSSLVATRVCVKYQVNQHCLISHWAFYVSKDAADLNQQSVLRFITIDLSHGLMHNNILFVITRKEEYMTSCRYRNPRLLPFA